MKIPNIMQMVITIIDASKSNLNFLFRERGFAGR